MLNKLVEQDSSEFEARGSFFKKDMIQSELYGDIERIYGNGIFATKCYVSCMDVHDALDEWKR